MRPAKIVAIVIGALLALIGLALLVPGVFLLGVYGTQRDSTGFFETSMRPLSTSGYALVTPDVDLNIGRGPGGWLPSGSVGTIRIRAASADSAALFIGIGPTTAVSQYMASVARDEVTDFGWGSTSVKYRHIDGGAPSSPPGNQDFWVARQEGSGTETLEWDIQDGNWTAVIMNRDGSSPVSADVSLGARLGILLAIGIGLTIAGVVLLAGGVVLVVLGARRRAPTMPMAPTPAPPGPPARPGPPPGL